MIVKGEGVDAGGCGGGVASAADTERNIRAGRKKPPLVKLVKYGFAGLEFAGAGVVKVFRCPKYVPYSEVDSCCKHDVIDESGYEKCPIKKRILEKLGVKEPWSETRCGLYRPTYRYLRYLKEVNEE